MVVQAAMEHAVGTEAVTALEFWTDPAGTVQLLAVGDAQVAGGQGGCAGRAWWRSETLSVSFGRSGCLCAHVNNLTL